MKERRRQKRALEQEQAGLAHQQPPTPLSPPPGSVRVARRLLAPYNSYGDPAFVRLGYYRDLHFHCRDCGAEAVWTAAQQQWWYETRKGPVYSTAIRCLACRRQRRPRPAAAGTAARPPSADER